MAFTRVIGFGKFKLQSAVTTQLLSKLAQARKPFALTIDVPVSLPGDPRWPCEIRTRTMWLVCGHR
jgi:hypothetical protein